MNATEIRTHYMTLTGSECGDFRARCLDSATTRYVLLPPSWRGTYAETLGWSCVDTAAHPDNGFYVASGGFDEMVRWVRELNAR